MYNDLLQEYEKVNLGGKILTPINWGNPLVVLTMALQILFNVHVDNCIHCDSGGISSFFWNSQNSPSPPPSLALAGVFIIRLHKVVTEGPHYYS